MYERLNRGSGNALGYRITRPLDRLEMDRITDELEGTISAHGKIRVLIELQSHPHEDMSALWEDIKFDFQHFSDIERLALVGGSDMEKWATRTFGVLTFTDCRCFEADKLDVAWEWLIEEQEQTSR